MVELKSGQDKVVKIQTMIQTSLFISQSYLVNDGSQNYLVFQPIYKAITIFLVFQIQSENGDLKDCQMKISTSLYS